MFTGLIREFGEVVDYSDNFLTIRAAHTPKVGDSIAVNGACLTVVGFGGGTFRLELSSETRNLIAIENLRERVHIEPAMRLGDRVEGHIVQGHIDCIGTITKITRKENGSDFFISIPKEFIRFCVPKGSVALDGVSLTINEVTTSGIRLTIIPHTLERSLFGIYTEGRRINIETDILVRSLHHLMQKSKDCSWEQIDKIHALY